MEVSIIKRKSKGFFIRYYSIRKKIAIITALLVIIIGASFLLSKNDALPAQLSFTGNRLVPIYYVDTAEKKVAFSFDACWGTTYTPTLLEILRENDIKTTYFLTGYWVEKHPDMVKKISEEGHEIGNHTYTHPHLNNLTEEQIKTELERVGNMIFELTGRQPDLFRPPFGEYSNKVIKTAEACGYQTIQWSIDSLDWKEFGVEPMVKRVTDNLHPGAIVLFHNNGKYTTEALPEIIAYAKEQGYTIVPISELLYKDNYKIDSNTGAQRAVE